MIQINAPFGVKSDCTSQVHERESSPDDEDLNLPGYSIRKSQIMEKGFTM